MKIDNPILAATIERLAANLDPGEYPPTEESVSALLEFSKHAKINPEAIALSPDGECCIIYNGRDMGFYSKDKIYYNKKSHTLDELIQYLSD